MVARIAVSVGACFFPLLGSAPACAQQITVQQPVFSNFSVATTVSVPDRGGALLGGVSSAGDFVSQRGPLGLGGRTRGSFRHHQNVTAHVYIHDFEAMDQYLLNQPTRSPTPAGELLTGNTRRAFETLIYRGQMVAPGASSTTVAETRKGAVMPPPGSAAQHAAPVGGGNSLLSGKTPDERAALYLQKGLDAVERGDVGVARIHFRMAARHGSEAAAEQLAALSGGNAVAVNR
jgi:hypothetical protein